MHYSQVSSSHRRSGICWLLILVSVVGRPAWSHAAPLRSTAPVWAHRAGEDIRFTLLTAAARVDPATEEVTVLPRLLVVTKESVVALDSATGTVIWSRADLRDLQPDRITTVAGTQLLLVQGKEEDQVISIDDGQTRWSSTSLHFRDVKTYLPLLGSTIMLVAGHDSQKHKVVAGVELATGETLWIRPVWQRDPERVQGAQRIHGQAIYAPPIWLPSGEVLVWLTKEGPTAINPRSGSSRLHVAELAGKRVPMRGGLVSTAAWQVHGERIYAPYEERLAAFDTVSGKVTWITEVRDPIGRMEIGESDVLVQGWNAQGYAYLDRLDLETGHSLWPEPAKKMPGGSPAVSLGGSERLLVAGDRIVGIDLQTGTEREIGELDFEGGEDPVVARRTGDSALFLSEQNLARVSADGQIEYYHHFPRSNKKRAAQWLEIFAVLALISFAITAGSARGSVAPHSTRLANSFARLIAAELSAYQLRYQARRIGQTSITADLGFFLTSRDAAADGEEWVVIGLTLSDGEAFGEAALPGRPNDVNVDVMNKLILAQFTQEVIAVPLT